MLLVTNISPMANVLPEAPPPSEGTADPLLLPEEILAQVFGYLTPQELGRLSLVSKVRHRRPLQPLLRSSPTELETRRGG